MPMFRLVRPGHLDLTQLSVGSRDEVDQLARRARAANPAAPLQVGVFVAAGAGAAIDGLAEMCAGGPLDGLAGEPRRVADRLLAFNDLGINRVTVIELVPGSYRELAPYLISSWLTALRTLRPNGSDPLRPWRSCPRGRPWR